MKNPGYLSSAILGFTLLAGNFAFAGDTAYRQLTGADNAPPAIPSPALSEAKSIYGENSMQEYYQAPEDLKKMADSTVAFVRKDKLYFDPVKRVFTVKNPGKLSEIANLDESEDFASQGKLSNCSGAYVGKGMVMTAGHCVSDDPKNGSYFGDMFMVFGWKYEEEGSIVPDFPVDSVYSIKKIEIRELKSGDQDTKLDFALVSMDREPAGRQPLVLDDTRQPRVGQKVFTIGYPLGLAVKINDPDHAQVYTVSKNVFHTNLDVFGGNSGGPAFDSVTGRIIGIVITSTGPEYSFELNKDFSFIAEFSGPDDEVNIKPELGTAIYGSGESFNVLNTLRDNGASISILAENKYLVTLPEGAKFQNRSFIFWTVTNLAGKSVFHKGRLMRESQDSFGTGVMRLPEEIIQLVRP
ncbi:MAG TPA: serine protease [Elusimicrobiales bacterium]|nr:serine protease [Elusimicrobiales bacterium]